MESRYLLGAVLTGGIAMLDLYIKRLVPRSFKLWESIEVIPGFFSLTYILNAGAAFGLFSAWESPLRIPFLVAVSVLALVFIVHLYFGALGRRKLPSLGLPLLGGGALANLYERATSGAVVDYLDFYIKGYHWPAFNLADASITVGVALLLIDSVFDRGSVTTKDIETPRAGMRKRNRNV